MLRRKAHDQLGSLSLSLPRVLQEQVCFSRGQTPQLSASCGPPQQKAACLALCYFPQSPYLSLSREQRPMSLCLSRDDEPLPGLEALPFRLMQQDCTAVKTLLLRLRRTLQESTEISPASSLHSLPISPCSEKSLPFKSLRKAFSCGESVASVRGIMEPLALHPGKMSLDRGSKDPGREENQFLQQQLKEKDELIVRLQAELESTRAALKSLCQKADKSTQTDFLLSEGEEERLWCPLLSHSAPGGPDWPLLERRTTILHGSHDHQLLKVLSVFVGQMLSRKGQLLPITLPEVVPPVGIVMAEAPYSVMATLESAPQLFPLAGDHFLFFRKIQHRLSLRTAGLSTLGSTPAVPFGWPRSQMPLEISFETPSVRPTLVLHIISLCFLLRAL
ncbi:Serine-rich coiled-coil domain-containing protein 1 [Labeo rohita]|uniref:Serine-rich coiled-coil domain-containing protein 1 n=1 Tax=Labeo rohita TaxID=84645 RepID=A0ABQ8MFE0_LABRO|nr:Serine-rich coiled-coil domain-containing protein 1 [Labeo rohita]